MSAVSMVIAINLGKRISDQKYTLYNQIKTSDMNTYLVAEERAYIIRPKLEEYE